MESTAWDERYAAADLVWSPDPNVWVVDLLEQSAPGRAVDVAAGEGRNAIWLAGRGWSVLATDFSAVAIARAGELADRVLEPEARSRLTLEVADATAAVPGTGPGRDLALLCYLHLPSAQWRRALAAAVDALAPGGRLVVVAHALVNLTEGVGGPQDPSILRDPDDVAADLDGLPVDVELTELRRRDVPGAARPALDTVVVARRR